MEQVSRYYAYPRAARRITTVYLSALFFALPLAFHHLFFDITEAKQTVFLAASWLYLLALVLARVLLNPPYGAGKPAKRPLSPALWLLCAFCLAALIGGVFGGHPEDAFFGPNNRYQGLWTFFTYALTILAISRNTVDLRIPEAAFLAAAAVVSLLGVLNHFGVDPIGFMQNLSAKDQGRFLSTIGNLDFYGSYLCLALPVALGFFARAETPRDRALSLSALVVVSFGALATGSDSTALGLLAAAALFPLALFGRARECRRLLYGGSVFFVSALCFGLMRRSLPSATYISGFSLFVSGTSAAAAFALLCAFLALLARAARPEKLLRFRKPYLFALLGGALMLMAALVYLNTAGADVPLGGAENYLRFSGSWGTDRGKIWLFCARLYRSFTPLQKLFGGGPGALFYADAQNRVFADAALDAAHNEYLQYLLVAGGVGLAGYIGFFALALRSGARSLTRDPARLGFLFAAVAYAAQASVNIAQPFTTPLFFAVLGVLLAQPPADKEPVSPEIARGCPDSNVSAAL